MYANNYEQLYSFFIFILVGFSISILFDLFRISRRTFKTPDFLTYLEDIIFWIITGIIILYSIFIFNNGVLRFYIFIGIFIGILVYMLFISKYFIKIGVSVITIIKKFFHILLIPIYFIIRLIRKLILKPFFFLFINIRKNMTKIINKFKKIKILNKKTNKNEGISKTL